MRPLPPGSLVSLLLLAACAASPAPPVAPPPPAPSPPAAAPDAAPDAAAASSTDTVVAAPPPPAPLPPAEASPGTALPTPAATVLRGYLAGLDRAVADVDRALRERSVEVAAERVAETVSAAARGLPAGLDPAVEDACLQALASVSSYAGPWLVSVTSAVNANPPPRATLTPRRASAQRARAALLRAAAAHATVRAVGRRSLEAAVTASRAYLVVYRARRELPMEGALPTVRFFAGLPTVATAAEAHDRCLARAQHRPSAPVVDEFSGAGGCAVIRWGDDAPPLDERVAGVVRAPAEPGFNQTMMTVRVGAEGFEFMASWD